MHTLLALLIKKYLVNKLCIISAMIHAACHGSFEWSLPFSQIWAMQKYKVYVTGKLDD